MEYLTCIMLFKDFRELTAAFEKCKSVAGTDAVFQGLRIPFATSIRSELLMDKTKSFCLLIFTIVKGKYKKEKGLVPVQIMFCNAPNAEIIKRLGNKGMKGLEELLQTEAEEEKRKTTYV